MCPRLLTGMLLCGLIAGTVLPAWGQDGAAPPPRSPRKPAAQPRTSQIESEEAAPPASRPSGKAAPAANRRERPSAEPMRVQHDPRLDGVLLEWEQKSSAIKVLEGEFFRFTYDSTFQVEKRGQGSFYFESPDKGHYQMKGATIQRPPAAKGWKVDQQTPQRWVCNGQTIININDAEKTYEAIPIPPNHQGEKIIETPLPFLFGMKAAQAKRRYKMVLPKELNEAEIRITAYPLWPADAANYQKAEIMLDRKLMLPKAVRLTDPAGTQVEVHSFDLSTIRINPRKGFFSKNQLEPNLRGYTLAQPADGGKGEGTAGRPAAQPGAGRRVPGIRQPEPEATERSASQPRPRQRPAATREAANDIPRAQ